MNDEMTMSQRADALELKMSRELDYIVIKMPSTTLRGSHHRSEPLAESDALPKLDS